MQDAVWITGGGTGIGRSLAIEFASNGFQVIISGRDKNKLQSVQDELKQKKLKCEIIPLDLKSPAAVLECYQKIKLDYFIKILINNAGVTRFKSVVDHSVEEINEIISTNLNGSIYTIKSVLPDMLKTNCGSIINILSVAANTIFTNSSVYAASKSGLSTFAKVLREEVKKTNIKVVNIYPGATETDIWPKEALEKFSDKMMKPGDLAKQVYKLVQEEGSVVPEEIVFRPVNGDL